MPPTDTALSPTALPPPAAAGIGASPPRWQVRLLGTLEARPASGGAPVQRFPSRAAVLLLARLALAPERAHPREELVELLWPGAPWDAGRNRLRQTLSVLKSTLEGSGEPPVILADRSNLRVAPGALGCDARDFERWLRGGDWDAAEEAYGGELLPGFYDEWVLEARTRLAALAERLQSRPRVPSTRAATAQAGPTADPGRLPAFWTRLFGIEPAAARLGGLLQRERLVTVVGAGGSGKTRLAVETARRLTAPTEGAAAPFQRAVFVSLVDCDDAPRATDAMAAALRVQGRDPVQGMAAALAGQRVLIVLDNAEQLQGSANPVLQQLLSACDLLHLLVTSRQRLQLDGEQVFELQGLALPAPGAAPRADEAAVALFIDRARAAAPGFADGPADREAVAALVRLLSGMPLAIELAASRMRSLTPAEMLALLTQGRTGMLDLLARDAPGDGLAQRHASMRHVVAWSWQQLAPALLPVLQAVATVAAPARSETLAAVAGLPEATVRAHLAQLHEHSLVLTERDAAGLPRHALLQPVREFVLESTLPVVLQAMRARLRQWLLDFGRTQAARGVASLEAVEAELAHVHAAILGAAEDGPTAQRQALAIAVALRRHWEIDTRAGLPLAVTQALKQALQAAVPAAGSPADADALALRSEVDVLLAFSDSLAGNTSQARALAEEAVALAPDARRRAHALLRQAQVVMFSPGDQSALEGALAEAVALAQSCGDLEAEALAVRMQFLVAVNRDNDRVRGEALAERSQALWERLGHRRNAYSGLMDRASCWLAAGRLDEAATALAACERASLQEGYATGHIMSSWQLGRALLMLHQPHEALAAFQRCLHHSWLHQRLAYVADALVLLPGGLALSGRPEDAARLLGFAVAHWQGRFGTFYRELERDVCRTRRWLLGRLGPLQLEALRLEGVGWTLPQAVAHGLPAAPPSPTPSR